VHEPLFTGLRFDHLGVGQHRVGVIALDRSFKDKGRYLLRVKSVRRIRIWGNPLEGVLVQELIEFTVEKDTAEGEELGWVGLRQSDIVRISNNLHDLLESVATEDLELVTLLQED